MRKRALRLGRRLLVWASAAAALFVVVNVALTATLFASSGSLDRFGDDMRRLRAADQWPALEPVADFNRLHGASMGSNADGASIRAHLERAMQQEGPLVFDQTLAAYALHRYGQVDARVLPPGVYVGARAIGPPKPPWVNVTKYVSHFGFFPRHSFVVVVPPPSARGHEGAVAFSAGPSDQFVRPKPPRQTVYAIVHPYAPGEYDFPAEDQAVHELYRVSSDPKAAARAGAALEAAAARLRRAGIEYRLVRHNSNTVIGCLLRGSEALTPAQEAALGRWPIGIRSIGIGFHLPPERARAHLQGC